MPTPARFNARHLTLQAPGLRVARYVDADEPVHGARTVTSVITRRSAQRAAARLSRHGEPSQDAFLTAVARPALRRRIPKWAQARAAHAVGSVLLLQQMSAAESGNKADVATATSAPQALRAYRLNQAISRHFGAQLFVRNLDV